MGATQLYADQTVLDRESVMDVPALGNFSSSGGFSNHFSRPSYQVAAVDGYLDRYVPGYPYYEGDVDVNTTIGLYNRAGRGYPDVSANGANLRAYTNGTDYYWYGKWSFLFSFFPPNLDELIHGTRPILLTPVLAT